MNRRFVLDVFLPAIGLLEGGAILVEKRAEWAILWATIPVYVFLLTKHAASNEFMSNWFLLSIPVLVFYFGWWLVQGVRSALRQPETSGVDRVLGVVLAVAVPVTYGLLLENPISLKSEDSGWWPLLALVVLILMLAGLAARAMRGTRGGFVVGLAPLIGFQGVPFLQERQLRRGIIALVSGWVLVGFWGWMAVLGSFRWAQILWGLSDEPWWLIGLQGFTAIMAPFLYFGIWAWSIAATMDSAAEEPLDARPELPSDDAGGA